MLLYQGQPINLARLQVFDTTMGGNSLFKGVTLFWQGVTVSCPGGNKQVLLIAVKKPKPAIAVIIEDAHYVKEIGSRVRVSLKRPF